VRAGHVVGALLREGLDELDAGADVFACEEVPRAGDGPVVDLDECDECGLGVVEVVVEESLLVLGECGEGGGLGIGGVRVDHGDDTTPAA